MPGRQNDFFEEVEVTRRRDNALDDLEELLENSDNDAYSNLAAALSLSNELVERENLAMRLMLEAGNYASEDIPAATLATRSKQKAHTHEQENNKVLHKFNLYVVSVFSKEEPLVWF